MGFLSARSIGKHEMMLGTIFLSIHRLGRYIRVKWLSSWAYIRRHGTQYNHITSWFYCLPTFDGGIIGAHCAFPLSLVIRFWCGFYSLQHNWRTATASKMQTLNGCTKDIRNEVTRRARNQASLTIFTAPRSRRSDRITSQSNHKAITSFPLE